MNRFVIYLIFILILLTCIGNVFASDKYLFQSKQQANQFFELTHEFRCLVCQNETIEASYAPLAVDLRNQIYKMILQGKSSSTIKSYLVSRYGDFILFKPPFNRITFFLWVSPILFLFIGFLFVYFLNRREHKLLQH